ncbi:MAG: cell division protein FtsL [Pseudomonadota bacterium]
MRLIIYVSLSSIVLGLAFWAYHQNYQTHAVLQETEILQSEIAALRERLSVLRAEWAYLNRPDRLRDLADMNFERLRLFPLAPGQFAEPTMLSYPLSGLDDLDDIVSARAGEGR